MKFPLVVVLLTSLFNSCEIRKGSGNIEERARKIGDFRSLSVADGIKVEILSGSRPKCTIKADDNLIDEIETEISGGELYIGYRDGINVNDADVTILLETPGLYAVEALSAANVKMNGTWSSDKEMSFEASSAAGITGEIDAPAVRIDAESSAKIVLKGRTRKLHAESNQGSSIEARDLLSETATAEVNSGASLEVHASLNLNAEANSGGTIRYRGNPSLKTEENSGGSISKIE